MLFVPRDSPGTGETAQGLVEYALIILFVALVVIVGLTTLGNILDGAFSEVVNAFPGA